MSTTLVEFQWGQVTRRFALRGAEATIGKGVGCTLVVPVNWLEDRHMVVQNTGQVLRARAGSPQARAVACGRPLTSDWMLLPSPAPVTLIGPDRQVLRLELTVPPPTDREAAVVLSAAPPAPEAGEGVTAPLVTVEPARGAGWQAAPDAAAAPPARTDAVPPDEIKRARPSRPVRFLYTNQTVILTALACGLALLAVAVLAGHAALRSRQQARGAADRAAVWQQLEAAQDLLAHRDYVAARAALEAAAVRLVARPELAEEARLCARLRAQPEIEFGARGYVPVDGRWLPADLARAWQEARQRDDPKIAALEAQATAALEQGRLEDARLACAEALALIQGHPVQPHPRSAALQQLQEDISAHALTREMQAKGMVWYEGKWMPADEARAAQGLVQFEGQWIKPEEKAAVLARRADKQRQEQELQAAQAAQRQQELARIEGRKQAAYRQSQQAVAKALKATEAPRFQPYESADVAVVYKDGWYLVKAPVETPGAPGAPGARRQTYICKLRPAQDDAWEVESATLAE